MTDSPGAPRPGHPPGLSRVTWWGHATVLVDDGARVLTDPVLTPWLGHLIRLRGLPPDLDQVGCDVVALSHLHADHLHLPSLRRLPPGTVVLVPRGGGVLLRGMRLEVTEVVAGDAITVKGTRITAVPAHHAGSRRPGSRVRARALGYLVHGQARVYFAGDTDLFDGLADIAKLTDGGPDLALVPVWGWGPWLRGKHLDPASAADALRLISPRVAVPIHWGTLWPRGLSRVRQAVFNGAGQEFASYAAERQPDVEVRVLSPGSSTSVHRARPSARSRR